MKNHLRISSAALILGRRLSFSNAVLAVSLLLLNVDAVLATCGDPDPNPSPSSNTIINDSFSDGITNNGLGQLGFQTTSSSTALDLNQAPGPVDFATGNAGRTIHSLFPAQTLEEFGDRLTFTFDFTTPDTVAFDSLNEDFRFGLFDTSQTTLAAGNVVDIFTGVEIDFSGPIQAFPGSPNAALNPLAGIQGELDNINAPFSGLGLRTNNVNNVPFITPVANFEMQNGLFLSSNSGFDFIAGGNNDVITLLPNSDYTGSITVEFADATLLTFDVTVGMLDAAGTFDDSFTTTVSIADVGLQVGVNTTTFDLIAFHATGSAFGGTFGPTLGSSNTGEPNNGVDISNVTITFDTAAEPAVLVGDVDLDGDVDFFDIGPFVAVLQAGDFQAEADADCNSVVDFFDIQSFIAILQQ